MTDTIDDVPGHEWQDGVILFMLMGSACEKASARIEGLPLDELRGGIRAGDVRPDGRA